MNLTPLTFVILLTIFYLILGTFMEALSMMVTTMPILVPVLKAMGVDLVWFGIIMIILLEAALVSPPEGLNLYIIQGIRKSVSEGAGLQVGTMMDLWIGVLPFMVGHRDLSRAAVHVPGDRALAAEPRDGAVTLLAHLVP